MNTLKLVVLAVVLRVRYNGFRFPVWCCSKERGEPRRLREREYREKELRIERLLKEKAPKYSLHVALLKAFGLTYFDSLDTHAHTLITMPSSYHSLWSGWHLMVNWSSALNSILTSCGRMIRGPCFFLYRWDVWV